MENNNDIYKAWVKDTNQSNLTNTQSKFAQWLFEEEQIKQLKVIGDLTSIFESVRQYVKKH